MICCFIIEINLLLSNDETDMFISRCTWCVFLQRWRFGGCSQRYESTLAAPQPDDAVKEYPEKIKSIVDEISKLTLIEVADLNELLKVYKLYVL